MLAVIPAFFVLFSINHPSLAVSTNKKFSHPEAVTPLESRFHPMRNNGRDQLRDHLLTGFTAADLIVGFPDSHEVRIIKGNYNLDGRIIIVNSGTLILDTSQFNHRGDLYILHNGKMTVQGGNYNVLQDYNYQYNSLVQHNGELNFQNTTVSFNGQSWGLSFLDSARLNIRDVNLNNGFMTTSLAQRSKSNVYNINIAGEFLIADSCFARFNGMGFALIWLYFPDSSRVDLRFPKSDSSFLSHWEIRPNSPGVQGIRYTVIIDSSNSVNWGTIPLKGCNASIRGSRLRTTGIIVEGAGNQELNGIINNSTYYNFTLPLNDRRYYLDSTKVFTWNIYVTDSVSLNIVNSVFGEMCSWGEPRVLIDNSICDGSGGYLGVFDSSQVFVFRSTVNTQVISGVHGLFIGAESNFRFGEINATRMSLMLFMNSFYEVRPIANDTAFIYLGAINSPPNPRINSIIPVAGTANCLAGPYNPVRFDRYRLLYGVGQSPSLWFQIGTIHPQPVENDTLERWNTNGLSVGWHTLRLIIRNTNGDTIDIYRSVFLTATGVDEEVASPGIFFFEVNSANPTRGDFEITYSLPAVSDVAIEIYNVSGTKVKTLALGRQKPGVRRVCWKGTDDWGRRLPAGIYFYRFRAGEKEINKKIVLLR